MQREYGYRVILVGYGGEEKGEGGKGRRREKREMQRVQERVKKQ